MHQLAKCFSCQKRKTSKTLLVAAGALAVTAGAWWACSQFHKTVDGNEITANILGTFNLLLHEIFIGNEAAAVSIIQQHPEVVRACRSFDKVTAAAVAAQHGQAEVLQALLQLGADVDAISAAGYSLLCFAASAGHARCAELLLHAGARVQPLAGSSGHSALHLAAFNGHAHVVRVFVRQAGCNLRVGQQSNRGQSALMLAAAQGHLSCVRELLLAGGSCQQKDTAGYTALHHAVTSGDQQVLVAVMAASAPPACCPAAAAPSVLALAAARGDVESFICLVHGGWSVLGRTRSPLTAYAPQWCTPLHVAAATGHSSLLHALSATADDIAAGNDPGINFISAVNENSGYRQVLDAQGWSPAAVAASTGARSTLRELVLQDSDALKFKGLSGETLVHIASRSEAGVAVLADLHAYGCPFDQVDFQGCTPLHYAHLANCEEAIAVLVLLGSKPGCK